MSGDLIHFPAKGSPLSSDAARAAAQKQLLVPIGERHESSEGGQLDDPEQLLAICELLREKFDSAPAVARVEGEFFYSHLQTPRRPIGKFDEREYFLGDFALLTGTACRILALRDQARRWFDRADAYFALAHSASAHFARVAYQRLALRAEERQFESVLELAPIWVENFARLGLEDDSLKCQFLQAHALKETDRLDEAKRAFREIRDCGRRIGNLKLSAIASENLFQVHVFLGENDEARLEAEGAIPLLQHFENRIGLAKLQLGLGFLLRREGNLRQAIENFRSAERQFGEIEMHADVAATHLILADLLLDANQPAQAEWEIRAALPVIDELKLVPEGIAALALLRDSIRRRQIDRQALRSLNGYFEELKS